MISPITGEQAEKIGERRISDTNTRSSQSRFTSSVVKKKKKPQEHKQPNKISLQSKSIVRVENVLRVLTVRVEVICYIPLLPESFFSLPPLLDDKHRGSVITSHYCGPETLGRI